MVAISIVHLLLRLQKYKKNMKYPNFMLIFFPFLGNNV